MRLSSIEAALRRFGIDRYLICLFLTLVVATLLPVRGEAASMLSQVTFWAVAVLFFLYGAKLSTESIWQGLRNPRLQIGTLLTTFVLFPILALGFSIPAKELAAPLAIGILYIGSLPSTVQSSIAFTSISGGNVAGAICAASISNLAGVVLSPLLISLLLTTSGETPPGLEAVWKICQQILLPFIAGQLCRRWLLPTLNAQKWIVNIFDRGTILLIVYSAFSAGVVAGIWQTLGVDVLVLLFALVAAFLALVMGIMVAAARLSRMPWEDALALFYCGSTKSLATGLPMAGILFHQDLALIVLPLMLFHLMQLVVCAVISARIAGRVP
ncbi:bile acid:sodium symporter family protein [Enterovirga rhinocerotis]|uniref:Sodium/bile acid cotransporter 7 n=1 Tax=Enterovirga rhinocerotis TaxID=1339210 RepID=A0A4V3DZ33_9HYPH|nr:bile acid:sodium symporter family protein [Enterovirga rhinocerotis]TDR94919.1 sodium/bile acid cotransporter 7 [Enterovirga rhinocerotis]